MTSEPGSRLHPGMSLGVTRLLPRWCPAYRQHELGPGSRAEPVKACPETAVGSAGGERETSKRRIREELSTVAGTLADSPVVAGKPLRVAVEVEPRGGVVLADECDQPKGRESHE